MAVIFVGDYGTKFRVTIQENGVALNISAATVKKLIFRKSDGSSVIKLATFEDDGSNGKIFYVSLPGDIDRAGVWAIQALVVLPTGSWYSLIGLFAVKDPL